MAAKLASLAPLAAGTLLGPTKTLLNPDALHLTLEAIFTYGSGGTTATAYVQTSLKDGSWVDVACFAFTTASANKIQNLSALDKIVASATPTDGALAADTGVSGTIGDKWRVKLVTTGTYAGTTLEVYANGSRLVG